VIPLTVTPDLRQACPSLAHFPGDEPAVEPHATYSTGATLRASYACPACGHKWTCWWDPGASGWPAYQGTAA
jgi:hypothetical protein